MASEHGSFGLGALLLEPELGSCSCVPHQCPRCRRYHQPCVTVLSIVKVGGGGGLKYALMVGSSLMAADNALTLILGISYDNDTNHALIDHVFVGLRSRIERVRKAAIPWISELKYRTVPIEGFPYKCAFMPRKALGGQLAPIYADRCAAHTFKGGTRSYASSAVRVHVGELPVYHGHALEQRLPIRAFVVYRKQADKEATERASSNNFKVDGVANNAIKVHWSAYGHLVFSVVLRMTHRATWSALLWESPVLRLMHNLVAYHFWGIARFWSKTSGQHIHFLHPIPYFNLHRSLVHKISKDCTWPAGVPYVGARHTEYFIEGRMEVFLPHSRCDLLCDSQAEAGGAAFWGLGRGSYVRSGARPH